MNIPYHHSKLELEYEQINESIRFLADVRFKLLALIPIIGGVAFFVLSRIGLDSGGVPTIPISVRLVVLLASILGFLATLGMTLYDQRNSELYNALIHRAKFLESGFNAPGTPGGLKQVKYGGQYQERPGPSRFLFLRAKHDNGLSLIYGPVLGAWLFPIGYSVAMLSGWEHGLAQYASMVLSLSASMLFIGWLINLDERDKKLYENAANPDDLNNPTAANHAGKTSSDNIGNTQEKRVEEPAEGHASKAETKA